jgi:hypothetical protein
MNECRHEYRDQGGHYGGDSNSDLRVLEDPPSLAKNVENTWSNILRCQLRSLEKDQALRQTCADSRSQAIASNRDTQIKPVPH